MCLPGLEINERPVKKAMLDLSALSISKPSSSSSSTKGRRQAGLLTLVYAMG
jgi:hypothetical protein